MVYWVVGVSEVDGLKPEIAYGPEAFLAAGVEQAKQKALARWAVGEEELDTLEVHVCPFQ